jgi:hypothetical protein
VPISRGADRLPAESLAFGSHGSCLDATRIDVK